MKYEARVNWFNVDAAELSIGDVVQDHGEVATAHDETDHDGKVRRVIGFGTPMTLTLEGDVVDAHVTETVIWSPTRRVKRVELRFYPTKESLPRSA